MYQEFSIIKISTSLIEKKIEINFSLDVDEDTATLDTLILVEKETSKIVDTNISVSRNVVQLELVNWPTPNKEYMIKIQKGITSIVDDILPDSLQRSLVFKSEITSVVEVQSPADHEEIDELSISWNEKQVRPSENLVHSYYLEISTDNAFYNVVKKTEVVDKNKITLSSISNGQYYLRVRAQKDKQYGQWSDVVTFIVSENSKPSEPIYDDEDNEDPVFEEDLRTITVPVNGETPESFLFEFDDEIDTDSIQDIVIIRRSI